MKRLIERRNRSFSCQCQAALCSSPATLLLNQLLWGQPIQFGAKQEQLRRSVVACSQISVNKTDTSVIVSLFFFDLFKYVWYDVAFTDPGSTGGIGERHSSDDKASAEAMAH